MPAPTTVDEFLELVRKSGVVEDKRLAAHLERLRAAGTLPPEPPRLAGQLVHDGVLTHFQAEQFLQGKWKRFTIGKYKVLERLGSGGMGHVYLCEHLLMRRRVAVKILPTAKAEDSSSLERFYREARAVAALDHPNIVRAYDIDQDDKLHFLVMEYVDGASLQEIIKRSGPMEVLRACHYVRQSALGLQHAHEAAGLVHRDIKPGNILVDRNGVVKVLDMGLARFFHDEDDILTKKYDENVLGTADYLAPEQALDSHGVDIRADIYSLGATFYFCLTGRTPFNEGTVAQKLIWHQTRQPKPMRSIRPDVPEGVCAVVEKMMAKDPAQRYQTPAEVAEALAEWTQTPIGPPPEHEMPRLSAALRGPTSADGSPSPTPRTRGEQTPPSRKTWQDRASPPDTAPKARETMRGVSPPPRPNPVSPAAPAPPLAPLPAPATQAEPAPATMTAPPQALPEPPAPDTRPAARPTANGSAGHAAPTPDTAAERHSWEELTQEDGTRQRVTDRPSRRSSAVRKAAPQGGARSTLARLPWWAYVAIAGGVVLLVIFVLWLVLSPSGKGDDKHKPREPIRVGAAAGARLARVLGNAKPGDHFLLSGEFTEAHVFLKTQDVVIEPELGKAVVWKAPAGIQQDMKLLNVQARGCVIKGITFDGEKKATALIGLSGWCPGVRLEDLELRNFTKCGVWVTNCSGMVDNRVTLTSLQFVTQPGQAGVFFDINPTLQNGIERNAYFAVGRFFFEGAGTKLKTPKPDFVDQPTFELPGNLRIEVGP
jgi:eukaryotic-like serine/threonine-protein kinase